jgi:predicted DNA-binding transcriptional regulator YafY
MSARRYAKLDAERRAAMRSAAAKGAAAKGPNPIRRAALRILEAGGVAHFRYIDARGQTSTRRVAVEAVTDDQLRGTDLDARAYRAFRLDRIDALESSARVPAGELAKMIAATLLGRQGDVLTEELAQDRAAEIAASLVGVEVLP